MKCTNLLIYLCSCLLLLSCNGVDPQPERTPHSNISLILKDSKGSDWVDKVEIGSSGALLSRHTLTVSYNGGEAVKGKTLYVGTNKITSHKAFLLETKDEVWDVAKKADSGSVLFSIDLPTLFPEHPTVQVYWEWKAGEIDRGRSIVEYKNVTVNGQPAEINGSDELVFTIPE